MFYSKFSNIHRIILVLKIVLDYFICFKYTTLNVNAFYRACSQLYYYDRLLRVMCSMIANKTKYPIYNVLIVFQLTFHFYIFKLFISIKYSTLNWNQCKTLVISFIYLASEDMTCVLGERKLFTYILEFCCF